MYKYNSPKDWDGVTHFSLNALKRHIAKVGQIKSVRLYVTRVGIHPRPRIMVTGTKGKARFGGFLWGYTGEGPRGLMHLLTEYLGYTAESACNLVASQPDDYYALPEDRTLRTVSNINPIHP